MSGSNARCSEAAHHNKLLFERNRAAHKNYMVRASRLAADGRAKKLEHAAGLGF